MAPVIVSFAERPDIYSMFERTLPRLVDLSSRGYPQCSIALRSRHGFDASVLVDKNPTGPTFKDSHRRGLMT